MRSIRIPSLPRSGPRASFLGRILSPCLAALLLLALAAGPAAAAEAAKDAPPPGENPALPSLSLDGANVQYQATIARMAQITSQALPLVDRASAFSEKAPLPGVPVKDQLSPEDFAEFTKLTRALHALYSVNAFEGAYARNLELLDGLYRAATNLHAQQIAYVKRTGTARGFQDWMNHEMKLDPDDYFYLELLLRLQRLKPSAGAQDFTPPAAAPDAAKP